MIGDYIQNLDVEEEIQIQHPKSVEGMQMFSEQIELKNVYRHKLLRQMQNFIGSFENGIHD